MLCCSIVDIKDSSHPCQRRCSWHLDVREFNLRLSDDIHSKKWPKPWFTMGIRSRPQDAGLRPPPPPPRPPAPGGARAWLGRAGGAGRGPAAGWRCYTCPPIPAAPPRGCRPPAFPLQFTPECRGKAGGLRPGARAVGVGGCDWLRWSVAGMRSVSSARLRCAWTLWAVS